jgi:subtilase family serine protease
MMVGVIRSRPCRVPRWSRRRTRKRSAVLAIVIAVAGVMVAPGSIFGGAQTSTSTLALRSKTASVVRPAPLFASTGQRFGSAKAALAYCQYGGCSTAGQLESLYDMTPLFSKGENGKGVTIAVVDSFGSPTIAHDLAYFDKVMKIPNPPKLTIIRPAGKVPRFNPNNSDVVGWATETTLDVECAHAMAPGADILLVETPVDETEGTAGFPQIEKAEKYVVDHHLAQVISQSFGATEETFPSKTSILNLRGAYVDAAAHGVTVLASGTRHRKAPARLPAGAACRRSSPGPVGRKQSQA